MKRYIFLQSKRIWRYLPGAFCAALVLLVGVSLAFSTMITTAADDENNQKVKVAIAGANDDPLIGMAVSAALSMDSSQMSLDMRLMDSDQALAALRSGELHAYIEVPEGFVDYAMNGVIIPLKMVTTVEASGLVSILREEVAQMIAEVLLSSQKGVYAMNSLMLDSGNYSREEREAGMTSFSFEFVTYVLERDQVYSLSEIGVDDGLTLSDYLLSGLMTLFMLLCCLPFAPLMIRRDNALSRMLASKGRSAVGQALADFGCYALWLTVMMMAVSAISVPFSGGLLSPLFAPSNLPLVLLVMVFAASMSFMLYTLASDLIGGVLLQFFTTAALCFVSGCMYPVFFFPESVQRLAAYLPTGAARTVLGGCVTGTVDLTATAVLVGYIVIFTTVGVLCRVRRVKWGRV